MNINENPIFLVKQHHAHFRFYVENEVYKLLLAAFFLISCQPNYNIKNSHYCVDTLSIQPQKMTESLGVSDYSVDSIVRLKLSGNVFLSNADKMIFLKNRIFGKFSIEVQKSEGFQA